jgi:hypothetical protein
MKIFLLLFFILLIFPACSPQEKELTAEEIAKEKQAIINVMKEYNKATEEKSWSKLVPTLASEVIFFGTDSNEVIKTFDEYKEKIMNQWNLFDKQKYGDMTDISIMMDKNATFASIIYGVPFDVTVVIKSAHLYLRMQRTLKKENDKWVIISGIVGATNPKEAVLLNNILQEKTSTPAETPSKPE